MRPNVKDRTACLMRPNVSGRTVCLLGLNVRQDCLSNEA